VIGGVAVQMAASRTSAAAGPVGVEGGSICQSALLKQAPIQRLLQLLKQGEFAAAEDLVEAVQPGLLQDNLGLRFEMKRCQFYKVGQEWVCLGVVLCCAGGCVTGIISHV
jgi:hypothetical protein